jgi:hypothetical protein
VKRIPKERTMKKLFNNIPKGKRFFRNPRKKWLDDVENDLKKIGFRDWRRIAVDRDAWRVILKEAEFLRGPYSQCRRIRRNNSEVQKC